MSNSRLTNPSVDITISCNYSEKEKKLLRTEILPIVMAKGQWKGEIPLLTAKGNLTPTEQNIFLIYDEHGAPWMFGNIIADITERKRIEEEREKLIKELQEAIKEIKTLRGILPLCSFCKKIRDDKGYWEQVDVYIHKHSQADISHGICPECAKEHYPDLDIYDD